MRRIEQYAREPGYEDRCVIISKRDYRLLLAVAPAFGPALTSWEAAHRLAWFPPHPAPLQRIADGCTIVWRLVSADAAAAAAAAGAANGAGESVSAGAGAGLAVGRGAAAVASLRDKENSGGGGGSKPWLAARKAGKGSAGAEDSVVVDAPM